MGTEEVLHVWIAVKVIITPLSASSACGYNDGGKYLKTEVTKICLQNASNDVS